MADIRMALTLDPTGAVKSIKVVEDGLEGLGQKSKKTQAGFDEFGKRMSAALGPMGRYIDMVAGMNQPALLAAAGMGALVTASAAFAKAIGDATREAVEYGSKLADMAAKTGISAESLQKLEHAGRLTGASTEQLSGAVTKMQKALVDGNKGFEALGLSQQRLVQMKPEAAFAEIAAAIKRIEDPAQQAAVAIQIFGKSGAELLPTLKSNLADAAVEAEHLGLVLSDDTVAALDAVGDSVDTLGATWEAAWRQIGATIAKQPEVIEALKGITEGLGLVARAAPGAAQGLLAYFATIDHFVLGGSGQQLVTILRAIGLLMAPNPAARTPTFGPMEPPGGIQFGAIMARALETATKNVREFEAAARKAASEAERMAKAIARAEERSEAAFQKWVASRDLGMFSITRWNEQLVPEIPEQRGGRYLGQFAMGTDQMLTQGAQAGKTTGSSFAAGFKASIAGLPQVIMAAIQGGGDVGRAVGAKLGGDMGKIIGEKLGGHLGANAGKIFGPLGEIAGQILGSAIGKWIGGLFSGGQGKKVNDMRDAFVASAGGIYELDRAAQAAGLTLDRLLAAKKVKDFDAAVRELQSAFDLQAEAQEALNDAVARYGFTIDELGPRFRQQELDKMAAGLLQDYKLLTASGIDHNLVLSKMAPAFNEYVQTAIRGGVAIPAQMQPVIQSLIDQKLLVDENGKAYEDADEAGIIFAQSMSEQFALLIDKIGQLVDALNGIPNIDRTVTIHHQDTYSDAPPLGSGTSGGGSTGGSSGGGGQGAAHGFHGWVDRPTRFLIGEAGRERVDITPQSQLGQSSDVVRAIERMGNAQRQRDAALPYLIRDALQQMPR